MNQSLNVQEEQHINSNNSNNNRIEVPEKQPAKKETQRIETPSRGSQLIDIRIKRSTFFLRHADTSNVAGPVPGSCSWTSYVIH